MQKWLETYVTKLLDQLHLDLHDILNCTSDQVTIGGNDTSVMYQIYGLLLSACDLKRKAPNKENETPKPLLFPSFFTQSYKEIKVCKTLLHAVT